MCIRRVGFLSLILLIFAVVKNTSSEYQIENLLQVLSHVKVNPPYIAILSHRGNNVQENGNLVADLDLTNDLTPEIDSLDPPYDQKAYLLYHALRTTEENEKLDPEAARNFQQTKYILRQALRKRCNQLNQCQRKCPKKIYITCTIECKATYDDYDVCGEKVEITCKRPRCGKTMPPNWRLG